MAFASLGGAAREQDAASLMGLCEHLDDTTAITRNLHVVKVLALEGLDPYTASDEDLVSRYGLLADTLKNLACDGVSLRFYVVKRRVATPRGGLPEVETLGLTGRYHDALDTRGCYRIELFLGIEKSAQSAEASLLSRFRSSGQARIREAVDATSAQVEEYTRGFELAMAPFKPRRLGVADVAGRRCSEIARFYNYLLEARWRDIPIGDAPLHDRMGMGRLVYPSLDYIQMRLPAEIVYGAMLGVADYPDVLDADALQQLLWTPADFVACAAWRYVSREFALDQARRQRRKLLASEDDSASQLSEITGALDDAVAGRALLGRCWFSVLALGRGGDGGMAMARLDRAVERVERALNERGFALAREDLAIACSHWSMFPGCWRHAPRVVTLSHRNYAALAGPHNAARGAETTPWGGPLCQVETPYGVPHRLALHEGDLGNAIVLGPSGAGKTVLLGWLIAHARAQGARVVAFDKDRGMQMAVEGLGGRYVSFRTGELTGINPVALAADPTFLRKFAGLLLGEGSDGPELEAAVRAALAVDAGRRRLRHIADALDPGSRSCREMGRWVRDGEYAWAFDCEAEGHVLERTQGLMGFDIGPFLDNGELRGPALHCLFHRIDQALDGTPTMIVIDEFWRVLNEPSFTVYVRDLLATIRKRNGAVVMATQSLADVIDSEIWRSIVEQSPTKIFFANRAGRDEDYVSAFGLSRRESAIVRHLPPRSFLLRRGAQSSVATLDLAGLDDAVALLSGRADAEIERRAARDRAGAAADIALSTAQTQGANSNAHSQVSGMGMPRRSPAGGYPRTEHDQGL